MNGYVNQINCSGPQNFRFNEQLLLAGLKIFVRETHTHTKRERKTVSPQVTSNTYEAIRVPSFPNIMRQHSFPTAFIH